MRPTRQDNLDLVYTSDTRRRLCAFCWVVDITYYQKVAL